MDGASYFGTWQRNQENGQWVPEGRGIVINYKKQFVYFGQIEHGKLHGKGIKIPFSKKDYEKKMRAGIYDDDFRVELLKED